MLPSKQQMTLDRLRQAWQAAGVNLSGMKTETNGKALDVRPAPDWPVVRIGAGGGIEIPQLRSYPKAFEAAVDARNLFRRQQERDAKAAEAAKPKEEKKPATAAETKPKEAKPSEKEVAALKDAMKAKMAHPETPTQRKQRQEKELEKKLAATK